MTVLHRNRILAINMCLLLLLTAWTDGHAGDLKSVICTGMPYRCVESLMETEGLQPVRCVFPKDPENFRRYHFSGAYSLLMVLKWSPVGSNSGASHLTVDEIWLAPNSLNAGMSHWPIKVYVVDLRARSFLPHQIYQRIDTKEDMRR